MTNTMPPGPAWIPAFLAALTATRKVKRSAKSAGINSSTVYWQRRTNRQFAEAWQIALGAKAPAGAGTGQADECASPRTTIGWRTLFLEALAETSNVTASAVRANVPTRTVYNARREEAGFAAKWRAALHEGYDNLEMEVLGYLRDAKPKRKLDVASALRLLIAHRETVARERALREDDDEEAVLESIDRFIDEMRERRAANTAILTKAEPGDGAE